MKEQEKKKKAGKINRQPSKRKHQVSAASPSTSTPTIVEYNMLVTGSSTEELADFRTMLTSLEGKHASVEDAPTKRCRKLHDAEKGKDALDIIDKLLKKLTKALKAGQKSTIEQGDQIKRTQQEQIDLVLIDMELNDIDPIKLC